MFSSDSRFRKHFYNLLPFALPVVPLAIFLAATLVANKPTVSGYDKMDIEVIDIHSSDRDHVTIAYRDDDAIEFISADMGKLDIVVDDSIDSIELYRGYTTVFTNNIERDVYQIRIPAYLLPSDK